ncbi:glycosyltransferase [Aestuariibaculum sp. YM273]|uniref:glycosyltransferase family 2 protein n=1 Tax=Aestuariibaculum sp. YM273 TaxID=3070659 RepID=UPI0027DCE514|nr:glycosyltransferase [Aestuariibaculum sp. YM273]WMI65830.1 glycosyltransferase [Aestuariibaculum sp. YM273]
MLKVSIIIPNYNHALFLQQRLDTVFHQTYQDFEVILLDDASTDGSQGILKQYKDHPKVSQLIINETNSGSPFKQWQKGIALAKGDFVWIAESDDYCELEFLSHTIKSLEQGVDICYTQSLDVDEHGEGGMSRLPYTNEFTPNIWKQDFKMDGNTFNKHYLLVKNVIPNASAVVFKRSIIKDAFFNADLLSMKMCGDWLFWIQLCMNQKLSFISHPLNYFRYHKTISRSHDTVKKRKQRIYEEAVLRSIVFKIFGLRHVGKERQLYYAWFRFFKLSEGLRKSFYKIRMEQTPIKRLFLDFIIIKLKHRFKS